MKIRKAKLSDVEKIHDLVNAYAKDGMMLARSRSVLYEDIRNFAVVEMEGEVVGVGALQILWIDLAEIRSLAIDKDYCGRQIGRKLVEYLLDDARELEIPKVFTLTYKPGFFEKCGFHEVDKETMPHKIWKGCLNCPKFPKCDEVCLVIDL